MTSGWAKGQMLGDLNRMLGERLRAARRARGWSLLEVEARSDQEFKASVLGAYERGERNLSIPRLYRLAALYGISPGALLPTPADEEDPVVIDLEMVEKASGSQAEVIDRYLAAIHLMRSDVQAGMTVRQSDLRVLAALLHLDAGVESSEAERVEDR